MRKISKRILSFILTLVMILTMGLSGVVLESAKAADSGTTVNGSLGFELMSGGTDNKIIVKTDLPTNTPADNFTAGANGCDIDETSNTVQWVGWIGMKLENDAIVFTFNFNKQFTEGQQYKLPRKALFGFLDNKKYYLDADYTFTWNGTSWSMTKENDLYVAVGDEKKEVVARKKLQEGYTAGTLVQFTGFYDFGVPADNTLLGFSGTVLLEGYRVDNPEFIGYKNSTTICLNNINHVGKVLTIMKDSVIYYGDKAVVITETFNKKCIKTGINAEGNPTYRWETVEQIPEEKNPSFNMTQIRYGTNKLIQVNTDLPVEAMSANFTAGNDGFDLKQEVNEYQQLGYASMANAGGTVVLTFNFNKAFVNGENYKLPKGAKFKFNNGAYELDRDYTFWFDGSGWFVVTETDTEKKVTVDGKTMDVRKIVDMKQNVGIGFHTETLVQFTGMADLGAPEDDTLFSFQGKVFVNGVEVKDVKATGYKGLDKITIGNLPDHYNKVVTIMAGSVISYGDKAIIINKAFHAQYKDSEKKWDSGKWSGNHPVIAGDTNENGLVDSTDLVHLKGAEGSTVTDFTDIIADDKIDTYDLKSMRRILVGDTTWNETKEILLAEENFNGGGEFVTFADRPADPTDPEKIRKYKDAGFNTATVTGEHSRRETGNTTDYYVRMTTEAASGIDTNSKKVLTLEYTSFATSETGGYIQLKTNISTLTKSGSYNFLIGDQTDSNGNTHNITLEKSANAPGVAWFSLQNLGKPTAVYWALNYGEAFQYQDTYTLKAGSELYIDGTTYVLDKTYKFEYTNDYRVSIENLDKAGLNVWIRNSSNTNDYFADTTPLELAALHKDVVDGLYVCDEPFMDTEKLDASNKYFRIGQDPEKLMVFDEIAEVAKGAFKDYFSNSYFFVNHNNVASYNRYMKAVQPTIKIGDYQTYLDTYQTNVLGGLGADAKGVIAFDLYPLGYYTYTTVKKSYNFGFLNTERLDSWTKDQFKTTGISPYYLVNMLMTANTARNNNETFCPYIETFKSAKDDSSTYRDITDAEEVTMQLYTGMACGADMFGYFLYTSQGSANLEGMIDENGVPTGRYSVVQKANQEALPFADVLKTFEWKGAEFVTGTSDKNNEARTLLENNSLLNLVLSNSNDGVLNSASASDDILVGYYTKGGQDAYMIANYNDPKLVTGKNNVTLNFDGCNYARVYTGTTSGLTSEIVPLKNGKFERTLQPGGGCFVIPVNAAS